MSDSEGQRNPDGTVPDGGSPAGDQSTGERPAQLPPAAPLPATAVVDGAKPSAPQSRGYYRDAPRRAGREEPPHTDRTEAAQRPSVLDALAHSRTTWHEVGEVAQRVSLLVPGLADARKVVRHAVISFAVGLTLVLLATLALTEGTWRLLLSILAGTSVAALAVFGALRMVSRLAARRGARELPGPAWLWVGAIAAAAVAATAGFTFSVSEVTKSVALTRVRARAIPQASRSAAPPASAPSARADAALKRGLHVSVERGVLYVPPSFESADGQFDLVIHYHGNTELVEQSVAAARVNALVLVINLGDGAGSYSKPLRNPFVFDSLLGSIEARAQRSLGLRSAQIRRIALSAWSAGFAAISQILSSRSRLDRVDAVLLMDGLHASFAPGSKTEVHPPGIKQFVTFARRAASGQKLMVVTHSAIETQGYPSTTRTADALLAELSLERQAVAPESASPPPVDLGVAKRAFPEGERNWLRIESQAQQGALYVYGYRGGGTGDHIAHLAQMSVTVLPPLRERWQ